MASPDIIKKAIDALTVANVAVTNIRLYPPTSAIIRNTVDRAYQIFSDILTEQDSVIFAESGHNFIICGTLFDENEQKKYPQALGFLELFGRFGLNSISFERGLERSELEAFLKMLSLSPQEIEQSGGLKKRAAASKMSRIVMDHRVYIVVDQDHKLIASIDLSDEEVVKYLTGEDSVSENRIQKIRNMAQDPEWINQVFQTGMNYILKQKGEKTSEKMSEVIVHMLRTLDNIADAGQKEKVSRMLATSIAGMDENVLVLILVRDMDGVFGEKFIEQIIDELDDERFERIAARVRRSGGEPDRKPDDGEIPPVYSLMMKTEKGKRLQEQVRQQSALEKSRREKQMAHLKAGIGSILKDEELPLLNMELIELLPEYIDHLLQNGKEKNAETIILKLGQNLASTSHKVRTNVSQVLAYAGRSLLAGKYYDIMLRAMSHWLLWFESETDLPPSCERLCTQAQELAAHLLLEERYTDARPVLEVFHQLFQGKTGKSPEISGIALKILEKTATEDVLARILMTLQDKNITRQKEAIQALMQLGETSVPGLLDILHKSRDMAERVRILRLVSQIGESSPHNLIRRIEAGGPWYYMRNLILVLGKIGNPDHLPHLLPFLKHEDFRVQRETLNTIYSIGGKYRGEVLLSALPSADERLKPNIVDMLGSLRYEAAVVPLLEMLKSKSFFSAKVSDKLKEKICTALGRIGTDDAIAFLKEIVAQKRVLGLNAWPENVKEAAEQALIRSGDAREKDGSASVMPMPSELLAKRNDDTVEESIIDMLLDGITAYARERRFEEADVLRQKLVEMDAMAFSEIIRADEIIAREKHEASEIGQDHLGVWPDLYDTLTPEEANALYYAMEEAVHEGDEPIFRQGEYSNRLYFIQRGQLKLIFTLGEREQLLKTLGVGDIVGEETFFSISVSTTSMMTLSYVELSYLDKKVLETWKETFPALESKLHDYCLRSERIRDILRNKGMDRRIHKRVNLGGTVSVDLLNPSGGPTGKNFKGSFLDISVGGISFQIKSSSRKNVSLLLGRKLGMNFEMSPELCKNLEMKLPPLKPGITGFPVAQTGTVIGVSHRQDDEYSVHVKFDILLDRVIRKYLKA